MIQMFHTSWPELWLNPRVGQPPALWYSVVAQMGTRRVTPTAAAAVLILNRRLALICLIACWRASCALSAGASGPMSADLSSMIFGISAPSFASGATGFL